jgi:methionine-rich copper-binding protein CopC
MRKLKVLLLAVGLVFSGTQSALAHAELVKSFPIANAKLTKAPKFVQLEFGEAIITLKSKNANSIVILDSKAKKIETSKILINRGVARVEFIGTLKPGKYLVKYRIVSADGHVLNAQFKFTLS